MPFASGAAQAPFQFVQKVRRVFHLGDQQTGLGKLSVAAPDAEHPYGQVGFFGRPVTAAWCRSTFYDWAKSRGFTLPTLWAGPPSPHDPKSGTGESKPDLTSIRYELHLKGFELPINGVHLFRGDQLEATQRVAEQEIVRRVQAMLPAYKIVHARVSPKR